MHILETKNTVFPNLNDLNNTLQCGIRSSLMKVIFILNKMVMGGIETAFLKLIDSIDREKFEIHVILMQRGGELERFLPANVSVEYMDTPSLLYLLKHFHFIRFLSGVYYRIRIRNSKNYQEEILYNYKLKKFSNKNDADCVICYHTAPLCLLTAVDCHAGKKILWLHTQLNKKISNDLYINILKEYDYICCVSHAIKYEFDCRFSNFSDKTITIYNLIDEQEIRCKAEEDSETLTPISLLTVARLSKEKGQLVIPVVTRKLLNHGYIVNWYLIGGGPLEDELIAEIKENNVEEFVHLLGAKNNPYPYIKKCDIYIQPSIQEGFGLTVQEAKILRKPIIASDIPAFREQIEDRVNGILIDRDPESFFKTIAELIDDKELALRLVDNLSNYHFDVHNELDMLHKYIFSEC